MESSRKRKSREKKGENGDRNGYTCVMEKKQKEKKIKRNEWMKEMKNNIKNKK